MSHRCTQESGNDVHGPYIVCYVCWTKYMDILKKVFRFYGNGFHISQEWILGELRVLSHKMIVVDKGKTLKVCSIIAVFT